MTTSVVRKRIVPFALLVVLALVAALAAPAVAREPQAQRTDNSLFWLTVLHNNDGESALINAGAGVLADFGGIARFKTVVDNLRREARVGQPARGGQRAAVMISSGDNFLAGPQFAASLAAGPPYYDAIGLKLVGYDAMVIGNHEFDFGPDVLADFIESFGADGPVFISANLDVSGEPRLAALEAQGKIAPSVVVRHRGRQIGIVGATTPRLPSISSPRNVVVDGDVTAAVQAEIDRLTARGVNIVIFASHLQSIAEDLDLLPTLRGVDVAIAGGGDELLANPSTLLIPGSTPFGPYPLNVVDADGKTVPVITTQGSYRYVGRLLAGFDRHGNLVAVDSGSGPVRVSAVAPDAVDPDPEVEALVVKPVQEYVASLAETVVGESEVSLNGRRGSYNADPNLRVAGVRTAETNEGNLLADALRWQASQLAASFGAPLPDVALQNGGGIRNDSIIPPGPITELTTFSIAPFSNFVTIIPAIPRSQFKEILENAVSRIEFTDGRFAQVSGFRFTYSLSGTAQVVDNAGNVITPGSRVRSVILDDGTVIVDAGAVVAGDPIDIATIDFLARGGDQYPYRGAAFTTVGVTYQQALSNYIRMLGTITAADYPEGGEGRITELP